MADIKLYAPKILPFAGGFVDDPEDHGGPTNMDVTLTTFEYYRKMHNMPAPTVQDLKNLSHEEWQAILKWGYWDKWQADKINNQSIAESLVEWVWGSGQVGINDPQKLLGLPAPYGVVGPITLGAVNKQVPAAFHEQLRMAKLNFIDNIISRSVFAYKQKHPNATPQDLHKFTQLKYEDGWKRRINSFTFQP